MNLVNITPVMTSNTTPAPYRCYASSTWTGHDAYQAFDNIDTGTSYWHVSTAGRNTGWLVFDFTFIMPIAAFSMYNTYHPSGYDPKTIKVYGSLDGSTFTLIKSFTYTESARLNKDYRFYFDKQVKYRAYKFEVTVTGSYAALQELKMFQDLDQMYSVSLKEKVLQVIYENNAFQHLITYSIESEE